MTSIMPELLDHAVEVQMWFQFDQPSSEMFFSQCIELFVNYAPFATLLSLHNVNPRDQEPTYQMHTPALIFHSQQIGKLRLCSFLLIVFSHVTPGSHFHIAVK